MTNIKSLEDVKQSNLFGNHNFDSIINETMQVLNQNPELTSTRGMDITDSPISPMAIEDDYTPVLFSKEVIDAYQKYVKLINNPETACEYSFVLLGKKAKIGNEECFLVDKLIDCNLDDGILSNRVTKIDKNKLNETIHYALQNGYNFISLGHTHPHIPTEESKLTIANYLTDEIKDKEYIREAGLNLSLQDFITYESLYQYLIKYPHITTGQTVIMFNGEITMISKLASSLKRFIILMDRTTGEELYVSSKEEFNKRKGR